MADVFISYSEKDFQYAMQLSTFLEERGWSVWSDKNLSDGKEVTDVITNEIELARAVIVIWSQHSCSSVRVKSEAARAQDYQRLIPIKLGSITYDDIPVPFDVLHTENYENRDKIAATILTQMSRPAERWNSLRQFAKISRYYAFGWFGIIGTALTLVGAVEPLLRLAEWAKYVISHWQAWLHWFWETIFSFIGFSPQPIVSEFLSGAVFITMLCISSTGRLIAKGKPRQIVTLEPSASDLTMFNYFSYMFITISKPLLIKLFYIRMQALFLLDFKKAYAPLPLNLSNGFWVNAANMALLFLSMFGPLLPIFLIANHRRLFHRFILTFMVAFTLVGLSYISIWAPQIRGVFAPSS